MSWEGWPVFDEWGMVVVATAGMASAAVMYEGLVHAKRRSQNSMRATWCLIWNWLSRSPYGRFSEEQEWLWIMCGYCCACPEDVQGGNGRMP